MDKSKLVFILKIITDIRNITPKKEPIRIEYDHTFPLSKKEFGLIIAKLSLDEKVINILELYSTNSFDPYDYGEQYTKFNKFKTSDLEQYFTRNIYEGIEFKISINKNFDKYTKKILLNNDKSPKKETGKIRITINLKTATIKKSTKECHFKEDSNRFKVISSLTNKDCLDAKKLLPEKIDNPNFCTIVSQTIDGINNRCRNKLEITEDLIITGYRLNRDKLNIEII